MIGLGINLAERGLAPDFSIRYAIRHLIRRRLADIRRQQQMNPNKEFAAKLNQSAIAEATDAANEQHYEVPAGFFRIVLGKHLKYSCAYFASADTTLDEAEEAMLAKYWRRADIQDGMSILDLGCGWGSFSLFIAEKCRQSSVIGISNSASQREAILAEAKRRQLANLEIVTADMNTYQHPEQVDRIISIEMFEHMRNYRSLFGKISQWMHEDSRLFIHVFSHQSTPYFFETDGEDNWMGRYFFTGGIMPSHGLYRQYQDILTTEESWFESGEHYAKTAHCWLDNLDQNKETVLQIFSDCYGKTQAATWLHRWRLFFLACAELFSYNNGHEWDVAHFLFRKS